MKQHEKTVYLVTHGKKLRGTNPMMTRDGFHEVERLKPLLPHDPPLVVCGTGRRHQGILIALGLWARETKWTALIGGPESLEDHGILLADGTFVQKHAYFNSDFGRPSLLEILNRVPSDTILCTGLTALRMLGKTNAKLAAVYAVRFQGVPTLGHLRIEEI